MLRESICHLRGVRSTLSLLFLMENPISKHCIMWHLIWVCTVCLWPLMGYPSNNGLMRTDKPREAIII